MIRGCRLVIDADLRIPYPFTHTTCRSVYDLDQVVLVGHHLVNVLAGDGISSTMPLSTLLMIRVLSREWKLPADTLVGEYDLAGGH